MGVAGRWMTLGETPSHAFSLWMLVCVCASCTSLYLLPLSEFERSIQWVARSQPFSPACGVRWDGCGSRQSMMSGGKPQPRMVYGCMKNKMAKATAGEADGYKQLVGKKLRVKLGKSFRDRSNNAFHTISCELL